MWGSFTFSSYENIPFDYSTHKRVWQFRNMKTTFFIRRQKKKTVNDGLSLLLSVLKFL
ncbi:hypothetical protein HMPREF9429_01600 [Megasphaera micronuciformis F0359]|uniref:Uncharacterized protein n=1 Tax=Megasphaera micronuciformis F0359 TaxID=706434 RepID=E2ZDU2_9FIRM|nr:hypothetical protein HMPREF9429_01600 [Megasphaera micronuciformis F0359]